jgi:hypothetical protein
MIRISIVLNIQFAPDEDLIFILRSGDILCRLACSLYQKVECHLLDKGLEFGIHKIIFFLELCRSLHIKRSLLFQVSDLLVWPDNDAHRKHGLIVMRTMIALERHARKSGWNGPSIGLESAASLNLGVSSPDTVMLQKAPSTERIEILRELAGSVIPVSANLSIDRKIHQKQSIAVPQRVKSLTNLSQSSPHPSSTPPAEQHTYHHFVENDETTESNVAESLQKSMKHSLVLESNEPVTKREMQNEAKQKQAVEFRSNEIKIFVNEEVLCILT